MIKKILILSISGLLMIFNSFIIHAQEIKKNAYKIIESQNLAALEKSVATADQNSLVIFDVRSVLINEQDLILQPAYKKHFKEIKKKITAHLSTKEAEELYSIVLAQKKFALIDKKILEIFASLQTKKIKFIALTSGSTGKFGFIENLEDLRIKILKNLGIDFSVSYPNLESLTLDNIYNSANSKTPMYKNGILFASKVAKGTVLKEFYDQQKIKVRKIIFIDNQLKNLYSVGEFCKQANINFTGIHYTNIAHQKIAPLNEKIVNYQFEVLQQQAKWISDQEANQLLLLKK